MVKSPFLILAITLVALRAQAEKAGSHRATRPPGSKPERVNHLAENPLDALDFSPKAIRERAQLKPRKKLYDLSKGLDILNVPCEESPSSIAVDAGETVMFTTPRYPKKYPKNTWCGWILYGGPTTRFNITCQKFKLQKRNKKTGECKDHLSLENEQFCGKKKDERPTGWLSYDWWDDVIFSFTSNEKKQYKGFRCTATAYIRDSLTTPDYPDYFLNDLPEDDGGM